MEGMRRLTRSAAPHRQHRPRRASPGLPRTPYHRRPRARNASDFRCVGGVWCARRWLFAWSVAGEAVEDAGGCGRLRALYCAALAQDQRALSPGSD
eukprot:1006076-Rhodomonas_salina.1